VTATATQLPPILFLSKDSRKPSYSRKQFDNAQAMLGKSVKGDPAGAEAALATWAFRYQPRARQT
jgi:hypothetical protein